MFVVAILALGCNRSAHPDSVHYSTEIEYHIEDILIETRDGAHVSGIVVRNKNDHTPKPVIFQFTIYVRDKGRDLETLKHSVDKGYVGVIAYTRGKHNSTGEILPYEHDGNDAYDVIDWISKQTWSDGRIGMFGGSYNGFTQWAACKKLHPALKTIVPYVANRPGMGLPMENNIFINPNYEWSFLVGNNKYLDTIAGFDRQRFRKMQNDWWESGAAYKQLDSIDGHPNRLFQRWIKHPSFDEYWQNMSLYKNEFAQIDIPVLSIDGYYNDSQNSGLYYLREHYKYVSNPEHYLIIGPYSHFGAQKNGKKVLNGYEVDENALIDTEEITYQWFDYIFKNGEKPEILKNKINYQVMGANEWRSAKTIHDMSNEKVKLFLSNVENGAFYRLSPNKAQTLAYLEQEVNFKDRNAWNNSSYPDPIITDQVGGTGFLFISEPLEEPLLVNGSFLGELNVEINKKDFDFGVTLYEVTPDQTYFHLSYIVGRASYADDITQRKLLTANRLERIPFSNTHLVSKKLSKGSRLLIYVDVNKNPFSELNYGTGKIVTEETIKDANEPLIVKWYNSSFVEIPVWKEPKNNH